jgi:hypothetical protein
LYPRCWRGRYGGELETLIEDSRHAGWRELFDVLKGALAMNTRELSPASVLGGFVLAGTAIAGLAWAAIPNGYRSTAAVAGSPDAMPELVLRTAFALSFEDGDAAQARKVVDGLQARIIQRLHENGFAAHLLDAANLPRRPLSPQWPPILGVGCAAGFACGAMALAWKRRRPNLVV